MEEPMSMDVDEQFPSKKYIKGKWKLKRNSIQNMSPWLKQYHPQSLADIKAHKDIIETSNCYPFWFLEFFEFQSYV